MSTDPEAKFFYGYIKSVDEFEACDNDREYTPWDKSHTKSAHGCTVDLYGYSENLGYFLAVEESLYTAAWDTVKTIDIIELSAKPIDLHWDEMLHNAANEFGIDIAELALGWHLVCLYF